MAFEFLKKLKDGLAKTRQALGQKIAEVVAGKRIDAATLEELEGALLAADVGVSATEEIIATLKKASRTPTSARCLRARSFSFYPYPTPYPRPPTPPALCL